VNSILRDGIKGQVTMIEAGIVSFEAVFMPHMLTNDGRTVMERMAENDLLPKPEEKIVHDDEEYMAIRGRHVPEEGAALLQRMLAVGVSRFDPDPLAALAAAEHFKEVN
jgi:hypothetical protein